KVDSFSHETASARRSCYSSSKHALQGFLDSLRAEVSCHNIHVTVVCPGYINTNLSLNAITSSGDVYGGEDPFTLLGFLCI
ncbi:UNVERIFIED_CONTAM: hypothetical protein GTU68_043785, partial [Idotea baltica]|nr:hypothetical protein [Idotea baltica]